MGSQESSGESLVIYISINSCHYWYVEIYHMFFPRFNYLPLLTSGSLKLSFCTLMWELHFHLDNDTTGKTTASYYWNLSVWVRHLQATVLLRLITPLICMLNSSFAIFCTVRKANISFWDVWFWCCCCKIMLLLFFLQQVLPLNAIQWILLYSCQITAEAVKLCWVVKSSFKS